MHSIKPVKIPAWMKDGFLRPYSSEKLSTVGGFLGIESKFSSGVWFRLRCPLLVDGPLGMHMHAALLIPNEL